MKHRFLFAAIYKDETLGDVHQFFHGTFAFTKKNISLPSLEEIKKETLSDLKQLFPNNVIKDYDVISLSYLGEMSDEEFKH